MVSKNAFAGKVANNSQKQISGKKSQSYINLPAGIEMFKEFVSDKSLLMDILPYIVTDPTHPDRDDKLKIAVVGSQWYKRPYKVHRNIGANRESIVCPTTFGKPCPICEYRRELVSKDGYDEEEAKNIKWSNRNLYCIIPIGVKDFEEKPYIWDVSQFVFQDKINEEIKADFENAGFPDLVDGKTLAIRFSEKAIGAKSKFADVTRIDFKKRSEGYDEDAIDELPKLDELLVLLSYSQIEAKFFGSPEDVEVEVEEAEGTEEKEEKTAPVAPAKGLRKAASAPAVEEAPASGLRKKKLGGKPASEPVAQRLEICPFGHEFGADCEEQPECGDCDAWSECAKAQKG